jgi:hypothetical protein
MLKVEWVWTGPGGHAIEQYEGLRGMYNVTVAMRMESVPLVSK